MTQRSITSAFTARSTAAGSRSSTCGSIWTNAVRSLTDNVRESLRTDPTAECKTPEQGAATSVFVATSPLLGGIGGRYFEDCNQALAYRGGRDRAGVASYPFDPGTAQRLSELSAQAISRPDQLLTAGSG